MVFTILISYGGILSSHCGDYCAVANCTCVLYHSWRVDVKTVGVAADNNQTLLLAQQILVVVTFLHFGNNSHHNNNKTKLTFMFYSDNINGFCAQTTINMGTRPL